MIHNVVYENRIKIDLQRKIKCNQKKLKKDCIFYSGYVILKTHTRKDEKK